MATASLNPSLVRLVSEAEWMMQPGERAALEGVLVAVAPSLSIEIGCYKGGSLASISARSEHVYAFDVARQPELTDERFPNVTFCIGDSHVTLAKVLGELAAAGANVDFVLVDGDHSIEGVRRDVLDLLESPCIGHTVILLHDTLDARVRAGLEGIDFGAHAKVEYVHLDFVQGEVPSGGRYVDHQGMGLGIIVTGWTIDRPWPPAYPAPVVCGAFATSSAAQELGARVGERDILEVERDLAAQRQLVTDMRQTWSWRLTRPLRLASETVGRLRR